MYSWASIFSFNTLFLSILLRITVHASPLHSVCSENKDSYLLYQMNIQILMVYLKRGTPPTGFDSHSEGVIPDRVSGLALCRGDISSVDCLACVSNAVNELKERCPYGREGTVWYDTCFLKYSKVEFFGKIDNTNTFRLGSAKTVRDPTFFNRKVKALLSFLATEASVAEKMFSNAASELHGSEKVYGLAQCTRDLSATDCKRCLDSAINELSYCCDGREGGRVAGGSCTVRYEMFPFVKA